MSMDIKLSKAQFFKIIQLGGFLGKALGNLMSNLGKKALFDLSFSLANNVWPKLATKATSSVLDKFERKISGQGAIRAGKGFTLFISNEDMNDTIKIVESIQKSGLLTDGATEKVKHEKKEEGGFLETIMTLMAA